MRWAQWIVDHTVTVVIFVFMIVFFGAWSYITLPLSLIHISEPTRPY